MVAFLALQGVIVALTELLSLGADLRPGSLAAAWLVVTLACVGAFVGTGGAKTAAGFVRDGGVERSRRTASASPPEVWIGIVAPRRHRCRARRDRVAVPPEQRGLARVPPHPGRPLDPELLGPPLRHAHHHAAGARPPAGVQHAAPAPAGRHRPARWVRAAGCLRRGDRRRLGADAPVGRVERRAGRGGGDRGGTALRDPRGDEHAEQPVRRRRRRGPDGDRAGLGAHGTRGRARDRAGPHRGPGPHEQGDPDPARRPGRPRPGCSHRARPRPGSRPGRPSGAAWRSS